MKDNRDYFARWYDGIMLWFYRLAASGLVPARWFLPSLPAVEERVARVGVLNIEIVSHCWTYSHFLAYQLSSLVKFPPRQATVTMTVFYSEEDARTASLLAFFENIDVSRVTWNWHALPKEQLFRRAIGRNIAARATKADWIWFTDCDLLFREECLDTLANALQGRRDALVFPRHEWVTPLLAQDSRLLAASSQEHGIYDIEPAQFTLREPARATGPLQIVHGDVARACGYCDSLGLYQRPADRWCKTYEDRALRWLLRTQGAPLEVPGVYRIRHILKGRYGGNALLTLIRSSARRVQSWLRDRNRL